MSLIIALIFLQNCFIKQAIFSNNFMGIHYDYKSTRGMKAMEKQAKRERKLAEKKAKRQAKDGNKKESEVNIMSDVTKPITLDDLTNPDKK